MPNKFKQGNLVVCIDDFERITGESLVGKLGRVVCYSNTGNVGVTFIEQIPHGHSLRGRTVNGYGWYMPERCLISCSNSDHEALFIRGGA